MTTVATEHDAVEAVCGACGYDTRGATSLICPECGGDLRRVGIDVRGRAVREKPAMQRARDGWANVIVVAMVLGVVIFTVASAIGDMLPPLMPTLRQFEEREYVRLPSATGSPRSFYVVGEARTWHETRPMLRRRVEMMMNGVLQENVLRVADRDPTPAEILAWMKACGVDVAGDPLAAIEAVEIASRLPQVARPTQLLRPGATARTAQSPLTATGRRTSLATATSWMAIRTGVEVAGLLTWLSALAYLWSRRRPRRPEAFTPAASGE